MDSLSSQLEVSGLEKRIKVAIYQVACPERDSPEIRPTSEAAHFRDVLDVSRQTVRATLVNDQTK